MESKNKCSRCNRDSVTELSYLGESLCKRCFSQLFEKRVKKTVRLNKLLARDDRIGVALSGGKDSAVALYIMKKLVDSVPSSELVAYSIDEGIEGFRDKSIKAASGLCEQLEIEHRVYSFRESYGFTIDELVGKPGPDKRAPVCSYCGVLRRKLLNEKGRDLSLDKIVTGHNLDDEVQTSLMNYIRGDLERIERMGANVGVLKDAGFVPRIKPLRECPVEEILEYAKIKEIPFYSKRCPYSGEAFRQTIRKVIDLLEDNHPGSRFQILNSTDNLTKKLKANRVYGKINQCIICGYPTSKEKCRACQIAEELGLDN
ncbi:MAG: TIGR00269 family protein [Candidatus Altiarchaeales archaeon ex4484_2]|nr:MAG: TIGR00269 family protein [Candidatus Altiarchaeales archaeon ex4484_2]